MIIPVAIRYDTTCVFHHTYFAIAHPELITIITITTAPVNTQDKYIPHQSVG